jgi:hypothetical protein
MVRGKLFIPIIADGFNRTSFHGFITKLKLLVISWLLVKVGIPPIIVTRKVIRGSFPAKVAINALVIDIKFPLLIIFVTVLEVCH